MLAELSFSTPSGPVSDPRNPRCHIHPTCKKPNRIALSAAISGQAASRARMGKQLLTICRSASMANGRRTMEFPSNSKNSADCTDIAAMGPYDGHFLQAEQL